MTTTLDLPAGVQINAPILPGFEAILTRPALELVARLHRDFDARRQQLLAYRHERASKLEAGERPDFLPETADIRARDWKIAPVPKALECRRVEITGPVDAKMVINAFNSGADSYMTDFEDSNSPLWTNQIQGQINIFQAIRRTLAFEQRTPAGSKAYKLDDKIATLQVRPRGWHLDEKHVVVDGTPMSGSLFDLGLFAFHNARALHAKDRGPYFYLPKLECMEEAALWDAALTHIETALGLPVGTMKVTVLIETLPAAFEMDEILHALRGRIVGLNCGRWDYIFSYLKTFRAHRDRVLPERGQVTMTQPFLKAYSELLIKTCHRRGAHAMGGMAAQIPIANDPVANDAAMARVRADKLREVRAGHDGTWVAHPALIPIAREIFDAHMPTPNLQHVLREDVHVAREDLIRPCLGTITRKGFENNIEVCVRYLAAWLDGQGCVPIHGLMEDAATAEIARAQLWQWLHVPAKGVGALHLDDDTIIDETLFDRVLSSLPSKLVAEGKLPRLARIDDAIALLDCLTTSETLAPFLTVPAYLRLA
jgi:malate synthase